MQFVAVRPRTLPHPPMCVLTFWYRHHACREHSGLAWVCLIPYFWCGTRVSPAGFREIQELQGEVEQGLLKTSQVLSNRCQISGVNGNSFASTREMCTLKLHSLTPTVTPAPHVSTERSKSASFGKHKS